MYTRVYWVYALVAIDLWEGANSLYSFYRRGTQRTGGFVWVCGCGEYRRFERICRTHRGHQIYIWMWDRCVNTVVFFCFYEIIPKWLNYNGYDCVLFSAALIGLWRIYCVLELEMGNKPRVLLRRYDLLSYFVEEKKRTKYNAIARFGGTEKMCVLWCVLWN